MWFLWALAALGSTSVAGVVDSILAYRYHAKPRTILWALGVWKVIGIIALIPMADTRSPWAVPLLMTGIVYYAGLSAYFLSLRYIDASVVTIAFPIQTAMITIASLALGDRFSWLQCIGIVCAVLSFLLLIRHLPDIGWRECLFLLVLSAVFVPDIVMRKIAINGGAAPLTVLFWGLISTTLLSLTVPVAIPAWRKDLYRTVRESLPSFWWLCALLVALLFVTVFTTLRAYETGPLALVAGLDNVRPFVVMLLAWPLSAWAPAIAPKENLQRCAVKTKVLGFALASLGVILIAPW